MADKKKEIIKCPLCGAEITVKPLKTWYFNRWKVSRYQCPNCGNKFNYYEDTEGKRKSWYVRF